MKYPTKRRTLEHKLKVLDIVVFPIPFNIIPERW